MIDLWWQFASAVFVFIHFYYCYYRPIPELMAFDFVMPSSAIFPLHILLPLHIFSYLEIYFSFIPDFLVM